MPSLSFLIVCVSLFQSTSISPSAFSVAAWRSCDTVNRTARYCVELFTFVLSFISFTSIFSCRCAFFVTLSLVSSLISMPLACLCPSVYSLLFLLSYLAVSHFFVISVSLSLSLTLTHSVSLCVVLLVSLSVSLLPLSNSFCHFLPLLLSLSLV